MDQFLFSRNSSTISNPSAPSPALSKKRALSSNAGGNSAKKKKTEFRTLSGTTLNNYDSDKDKAVLDTTMDEDDSFNYKGEDLEVLDDSQLEMFQSRGIAILFL